MAYIPTTSQQLTYDTDNGRIDSSPCVVVLPSGQQFVFYSKFLTTGKESYSRISFVSPSFTIDVEAGSGTINGTPVSWSAGSLVSPPNSYNLVYVTNTGTLGIGANLSMTFLKDVIILAYVSSGSTSITRVYELEHTGNYIYVRKQVLSGTDWVWDDYELFLNTGSEPSCYYNSIEGKIYLVYKKDSSSYTRIFNPSDELTWEYIANVQINAGTITLNRDPENSIGTSISSGYKSSADLLSDLFPLLAAGFCFINNQIYMYLPPLTGEFLNYIVGDVTYEFYTKTGSVYSLEASYTVTKINTLIFAEQYRLWSGTYGVKYVGIRLHSLLFQGEYATASDMYSPIELYAYPAIVSLAVDYNIDTKDDLLFSSVSSGYQSSIITTAEFVETKYFDQDSGSFSLSSGYQSKAEITAEFEETKQFNSDAMSSSISSGYESTVIVISFPIY